ncbi:MAG TPA: hypothetical protein DDW65_08700 [Firmicutes bacterium]|jgi:hypothetical protein|nr:hypothetical protein [Bacillota bacterium]
MVNHIIVNEKGSVSKLLLGQPFFYVSENPAYVLEFKKASRILYVSANGFCHKIPHQGQDIGSEVWN